MNDRCPTCHKKLKNKEKRLRNDNGVSVLYCKECHDLFFGKDEK